MTGLIQYFGIGAADGSGPSFKGIITGGRHNIPSEVKELRGIGNYKPYQTYPGIITPGGSVEWIVQDKTLLEKGVRATGVLPEFGVVCGDTDWKATHKNCKASRLSLHGAEKEELRATLDWMTLVAVEGSGAQAHAAETTKPYLWYQTSLTGLTGVEATSFDVSIPQKLELKAPMFATYADGTKRFGKYLVDQGQDAIELTMTLLKQIGTPDITADALAVIASVVITYTNLAGSLIITLSNVYLADKNQDFSPEAIAGKGLTLRAEDIAIT